MKARPTDCAAFSPCPKYPHPLLLRRRSYQRREPFCRPSFELRLQGKPRAERSGRTETGTVRPEGEPGSVGRTSRCWDPNLHHHNHSLDPQREQTGRWCRTSWLLVAEDDQDKRRLKRKFTVDFDVFFPVSQERTKKES